MKIYNKENIKHGTKEFPIALYKIKTTRDMEILQYFHWHDEYEIYIIDKGGAIFYADDKQANLYENDIVFINKGCTHGAYRNGKLDCNFTAIVFNEDFITSKSNDIITRFFHQIFTTKKLSSIFINTVSNGQTKIIELINELKLLFDKRPFGFQILVKAKILEIIGIILIMSNQDEVSHNSVSNNQSFIKNVITYIQNNYSRNITIDDIANNSNMSKGHFERSFKKHFKMTPFEYLIHYRITKSLELLSTTNKTISEISLDSGFNSFSYYSKCFKQIMNTTPRKYRQLSK